jgi:hypothetical protein
MEHGQLIHSSLEFRCDLLLMNVDRLQFLMPLGKLLKLPVNNPLPLLDFSVEDSSSQPVN